MFKYFDNYLSKKLGLFVIIIGVTFITACANQTPDNKFEGYQIKFDYENYPEEREIAYQYYLDKRSKNLPGIPKEKIGIDLYDIDSDGEKEIFVYVDGEDKCPRVGCPFATLKIAKDNNKYKEIPWSTAKGVKLGAWTQDTTIILKSRTLGYNNIFTGKNQLGTIWKWNGEYYEINRIIK